MRVTPHRAMAVIVSDFLSSAQPRPGGTRLRRRSSPTRLPRPLSPACDRPTGGTMSWRCRSPTAMSSSCPPLGRLSSRRRGNRRSHGGQHRRYRKAELFAERQAQSQAELARVFRSAGIDSIQLRTDRPYGTELGSLFRNARAPEGSGMNMINEVSSPRISARPSAPTILRDIKPPVEIPIRLGLGLVGGCGACR